MSYRKENLIDLFIFLPICPAQLSTFRHVTPQNVTGDFSKAKQKQCITTCRDVMQGDSQYNYFDLTTNTFPYTATEIIQCERFYTAFV